MPAIAARKRATEALGRSAVVFLLGAGFALGAVLPIKAKAAPYRSEPVQVPAVLQAVHFDRGGQGIGYSDRSPGNAGGVFRATEDVDIIDDAGNLIVNGFQTGEWLAYTVNVPATGDYRIQLKASTTYANSSFHIKVDDQDVTGPITVPTTGGWSTFNWVGANGVRLAAGRRVIKVFANQEYFNLDKIRIQLESAASAEAPATPYNGLPWRIPGTIPAEKFDRGGEGVGYHDRVRGNAGKAFRTSEDVDIIARDAGGYVVNNFQTGEWLRYTVDVAETGRYDIQLQVSSASTNGRFHVQVDGKNVTGTVAVPNTGGWDIFRWVGKKGITLKAGKRVIKVISDQQYFNLNSLRIVSPESNPSPNPGPADTGARQFFCTFQSSPGECGFGIQAKSPTRVTVVSGGRDGGTAVKLRTEPGDNNLFGSGSAERADLSLSVANTDCYQGKEAWWAHSILFPSDYVPATSGWGVVMDFHQTGSVGQANFHVDSSRWDGLLRFRGYGGIPNQTPPYERVIGPVVKNQWYDFVYHVRWSSGSDGFMQAWVNGKKMLDHRGPTIYSGDACYLKLANYHTAFGQATAVIHDRVIRGTTWQAVSLTPLEGVQ